jgi:mercuric ion binding protein
MKKLMTYLIVFTLIIGSTFSMADTMTVDVNGMVCAFCAQGIEKKIRALPETKDVFVSLEKKIVVIELKDKQTLSDDAIKTLIKDAGYDVTSIKTSKETLDQVKATIEKK